MLAQLDCHQKAYSAHVAWEADHLGAFQKRSRGGVADSKPEVFITDHVEAFGSLIIGFSIYKVSATGHANQKKLRN